MAKSHAVRTLEKKRAHLKADLARCDMVRARTLESLAHVEATLALFREAKHREAPTGPFRRWLFRHGELKRLILSIEREASEPLTHRQIARAIIARMGWDTEDRELVTVIAEKVKGSRRRLRPRGVASSLSMSG
jgi:anti-sigma factor RsiW